MQIAVSGFGGHTLELLKEHRISDSMDSGKDSEDGTTGYGG